MVKSLKFKTGDIFVRYGKTMKAFKIRKGRIFLRPHLETRRDNGNLIYSVPLKNIRLTNMRRIVSKEKLKGLYIKVLEKKNRDKQGVSLKTSEIKVLSESNDLRKIMKVIKVLFLEKQKIEGELPSGRKSIYKQVLDQAGEEVAVVKSLSLEKAKETILAALKTGK